MANKQISQLTAKPVPVASTDQFGIDDNSSDSWKITVANLQTFFNSVYLALAGGTMLGNLTLAGDPTTNLMAATKQYVDALATGLNVQPSCRVGTTAALTVTYNNGASGVGATLTNAGAMAALSIDGVALSVGNRVLVKDQASALQNGIYTVTTVGSGAANWVMTRATDFDTPTEIQPGDFVLALEGTANAQTQWVQTATVATVGTDSIVWNQFGADINAVITAIQNNTYVYCEDTGAADAYVATPSPAITAYVEGQVFILDPDNANATTTPTLAVSGLAAKTITNNLGGALVAGDIVASQRLYLLYDGTNFRLINRNLEKRIQNESFNYILDTGAADAYVATLVPAATAYVAGMRISLKIANQNTGASTLNVNGIGAQAIKRVDGSALLATDLLAGQVADLRYDGTNFQLLNPGSLIGSFNAMTVQRITASGAGTYTPTAGMKYVIIQAQAAGAGGGGCADPAANQFAFGAGGGGGEYIEALFSSAQIGASKAYSVGAKGTGGAAGNNAGANGGNTTFNTTWIIATGGTGGGGGASAAASQFFWGESNAGAGGTGGSVATGTIIKQNIGGMGGVAFALVAQGQGSSGGTSGSGVKGAANKVATSAVGSNGTLGNGGGGALSYNGGGAFAGGDGGDGFITFIEFLEI